MRSAKQTPNFPYGSKLVCYIEVLNDGTVRQLSDKRDKLDGYLNASAGKSRIFAVWPGNWRSDLFVIDDLDAFAVKQGFAG